MITGTFTLTEVVCCNCGTHFGMDTELNRLCHQNNDKYFYCPNGHSQHYTVNELDELKRKNQSLNSQLEWAIMEAETAKRERKSARSALTKTRNRIVNGVCPCCHRTFKQLAAHMTSKHPEFKEVAGLDHA